MENQLSYVLSKTWFLVIFAGIMGFIVVDKSFHTFDYLPSRIVVSAIFPASVMFTGILVGFNIGTFKNKKTK